MCPPEPTLRGVGEGETPEPDLTRTGEGVFKIGWRQPKIPEAGGPEAGSMKSCSLEADKQSHLATGLGPATDVRRKTTDTKMHGPKK